MARLKTIAARTFSWAFGLCWSGGIALGLWAVRRQVIADLGQSSALFFFGVPSLLLLLFSMRKAAREQAK